VATEKKAKKEDCADIDYRRSYCLDVLEWSAKKIVAEVEERARSSSVERVLLKALPHECALGYIAPQIINKLKDYGIDVVISTNGSVTPESKDFLAIVSDYCDRYRAGER